MKKNRKYLICIIIIVVVLLLFFLYQLLEREKEKYRHYNDFTRASDVMFLSCTKQFDMQFYKIRQIQTSNFDNKLSRGDLIYNFSKYNIIPSLVYIKDNQENEKLNEAFNKLFEFYEYFIIANIGLREKIFTKQDNGFYYYEDNGYYIYPIEKPIISKKTMNSLYIDYIKSKGIKSVKENIANRLCSYKEIRERYSREYVINHLNDNDFSNNNKIYLYNVLGEDISDFSDYLMTFIKIDKASNKRPEIIKKIDTETINLKYKFKKLDRIYSNVSKYYTYSYQLDLEYLWKQLDDLEYPILYS